MLGRATGLIAAAAVGVSSASGAIVTMNFSGSFGAMFGSPYPGAAAGNTFAGSVTYDTSSIPSTDDGFNTFFPTSIISMSATISTTSGPYSVPISVLTGTVTYGAGTATAGLAVTNDEEDFFDPTRVFDKFNVRTGAPSINAAIFMGLTARPTLPDTGPLSSRLLPESFDLSRFGQAKDFQIINSFPSSAALGTITSVTFTPAPGSAAVLGGLMLVATRRRRVH